MTGRVWTPSDWISGNCLWNCIFQTCFFFHCIIEEWRPFEKTPLRLDSVWVSDCFLGKNCMDFWKVWRLLGENFDWNTFIFERGQDFQRNSGVKNPENDHRFQTTPFLRKSIAPFRKIGRYLCQNPLLLLVKSAAVFWDKATTALGKTGRERFFLRRRVLQNRSGALLK